MRDFYRNATSADHWTQAFTANIHHRSATKDLCPPFKGIKLVLTREIQMLVTAKITCGILLCEEKLPPTNTKSSSIFNMTVFINQPTCSRTPKDEFESRVLVASINSENPNISHVTDATKAFGVLESMNASIRIEMFKHDDCSSDFTCEVQGLDSQGRVFLSSTTLLQQQGDNNMGNEIVADALKEVKDKVESQAHSLENRIDSLENRMEDKIDSKLSALQLRIESTMHSLENRIEDKIDAKLSAANTDDTHGQNEASLDTKLSTLRRELSDSQQNAVTIILDYIDARFFSNQVQLIHELRDPISKAISSSDNTLKGILSTIGSNQRKTQSSLTVIDGQLSMIKKSIINSKQLSTCKRGMIRPSSSYPYPHPVVYPHGKSGQRVSYLCDMLTDGGGWIVIQRRFSGKVDFQRDWETFKQGFGTLDEEFWLGNERIHAFTSSGTWELRVDLKYKGKEAYALYSNFNVEGESEQYTLRIGTYSGTAGDSLRKHNGLKFSTFDRDNDEWSNGECAKEHQGGWWYHRCDDGNLNGEINGKSDSGLEWQDFALSNSCSFSEMKIRQVA
ncbi:ficolin-1 [Plakobranchus ocellatus]|uniref:Ficolin-1 n=1 Tax=Plakobranchus ocellatus TaxID=259542 RepID=A0AAV4CZD8_9GAST|nr:ficolin-1 [Plakobranchus ocellatus]